MATEEWSYTIHIISCVCLPLYWSGRERVYDRLLHFYLKDKTVNKISDGFF